MKRAEVSVETLHMGGSSSDEELEDQQPAKRVDSGMFGAVGDLVDRLGADYVNVRDHPNLDLTRFDSNTSADSTGTDYLMSSGSSLTPATFATGGASGSAAGAAAGFETIADASPGPASSPPPPPASASPPFLYVAWIFVGVSDQLNTQTPRQRRYFKATPLWSQAHITSWLRWGHGC